MPDNLFYQLGRKVGPKVRKARWMWESMTGTEADAIRLEHGVGQDLANEARRQLQMDADPRVRGLLDEVGDRLSDCVGNRLRSFHFEAFHSGQPNAFALPGGYIFVSRSILDLVAGPPEPGNPRPARREQDSDASAEALGMSHGPLALGPAETDWNRDEVAFILAHEMGHVIRGHAIERIVANSAVSVLSRTTPVRGALGGWLRTAGVRVLETAYSRDQESEADRLGVRLLMAADFAPEGSIRLLGRLAKLRAAASESETLDLGEYLSTHPTCGMRINRIRRYLAETGKTKPPSANR